LLCSTPNGL
nr:Chain E, Synthetic peptide [synthetic construct]